MVIKKARNLYIIILILASTSIYAQNDSISKETEVEIEETIGMMFKSEIKMDIDKEIYSFSQGNSHFTTDQKSGIIAMMVPNSIDKLKADLEKEKPKEGFEQLDKGEFEFEGKTILFTKQKVTKDDEEYIVLMYAKENDEKSSIMITSFFEAEKLATYENHVEKAAKSAEFIK